jgi:hypothetical protein
MRAVPGPGWVLSRLCILIIMSVLISTCAAPQSGSAQPSEQVIGSTGILEGRVTKIPVAPMETPGSSSPVAVPHVSVIVARPDERIVATVETDTDGYFRVELPAGTYKVTMRSLHGAMSSKDLPATVKIAIGQENHLPIRLDTGIR